jgi:phosphohistidine phosphatase
VKRLLLLRHAKAVPADDAVADFGRKLTERGEREARHMGVRLRSHQAAPDAIVASPAARALRTAELVAGEWAYPVNRIATDQRLYLAEPAEILAVIGEQDAALTTLMIVAHNPGLTDLAHELLPALDVDDLPTAGIVALDVRSERWAALDAPAPTLLFYDFPKNSAPPLTAR